MSNEEMSKYNTQVIIDLIKQIVKDTITNEAEQQKLLAILEEVKKQE